jgi:hypothetical protein
MPVGPAPSLCCPNVTILGSEDISGVYSFVGMAISTYGENFNYFFSRRSGEVLGCVMWTGVDNLTGRGLAAVISQILLAVLDLQEKSDLVN